MTPLSPPLWRLTRVGIGIKLTGITCGSSALAAITGRTPWRYRVDRGERKSERKRVKKGSENITR